MSLVGRRNIAPFTFGSRAAEQVGASVHRVVVVIGWSWASDAENQGKLKAKTIATMDNNLSILISYMLVPPSRVPSYLAQCPLSNTFF
jgi:hypothetical protein